MESQKHFNNTFRGELKQLKHLMHHEVRNIQKFQTLHSKLWCAYLTGQQFPCFVNIACLSSKEPGTSSHYIHQRY